METTIVYGVILVAVMVACGRVDNFFATCEYVGKRLGSHVKGCQCGPQSVRAYSLQFNL